MRPARTGGELAARGALGASLRRPGEVVARDAVGAASGACASLATVSRIVLDTIERYVATRTS